MAQANDGFGFALNLIGGMIGAFVKGVLFVLFVACAAKYLWGLTLLGQTTPQQQQTVHRVCTPSERKETPSECETAAERNARRAQEKKQAKAIYKDARRPGWGELMRDDPTMHAVGKTVSKVVKGTPKNQQPAQPAQEQPDKSKDPS